MDLLRNKRAYIGTIIALIAFLVVLPIQTVFGAEDPQVGTASAEIENMIELGKTLMGKTPYVWGGGHHDWQTQKAKDIPDGLDCSSYVAWALYNGMGIDIGLAPVSGDFENYFEKVATGTLDGAKRGDIVASDGHIEIYLGEDDNGKPMSLHATNDRTHITITETNWGDGMSGKVVLRPSVADAKAGKNGLKYDESLIKKVYDGKFTSERETTTSVSNNTGKEADLYSWLDPIVDFSGASNTHSKSPQGEKRIDSNSKGLKGHQSSLFEGLFW